MTVPHPEHPCPSLAGVLEPEAAREWLEERKARFEQMAAQSQEVIAETVGADSETVGAVTASLQERLASDTEGEWR